MVDLPPTVPTAPSLSSRGRSTPAVVLTISTVISSWLLMQVVHECGHVFGAVVTGGRVRRVVLVPWELSRTDLLEHPHPLFVCWAGPIFGAAVPLVAWSIAVRMSWSAAFWLRFFAAFCLIANGTYIGVGEFTGDGDAGDLMRAGSPGWTLWLFAVVTVPCGLFLWHRLGKDFGIGSEGRTIHGRTAAASLLILAIIFVVESLCALI